MEERNGKKQENEVGRMNLLTKLKNQLSKELNTDWRIVALDSNQALIETQEKLQQANQRIADQDEIIKIYKEKRTCLNHQF